LLKVVFIINTNKVLLLVLNERIYSNDGSRKCKRRLKQLFKVQRVNQPSQNPRIMFLEKYSGPIKRCTGG